MKKITQRIGAGTALAIGLVPVAAVPTNAGNLRAWDRANYSGTLLVDSSAIAVIDVVDDKTRSTKNETSFGYSARNNVGWWSEEVVYIPAGYVVSNYNSANDTVDHFDRVG